MDIRQMILRRLKQLGWSSYRLVQAVKDDVPASTIYGFLRAEHPINSDHLGHIFEAIDLKLAPRK